jgi:hypothetical protein
MKRWSIISCALLSATLAARPAIAVEYQFSVPTGDRESRAFLWIPPTCQHVRALLIADQVILEDQVCADPLIRQACTQEDMGIVILYRSPAGSMENYHRLDLPRAKVVDQIRKLATQSGIEVDIQPPSTAPAAKKPSSSDVVLQNILDQLAEQSGYAEVATAPLLSLGHSGGAIFAWNVAYCWPERILGVIGLHSAVIFPPPWDPQATPAGFPALCISGEYESWTGPTVPLDNHWRWLRGGVLDMRGHYDSQACELVQPGCTHFNWDQPLARYTAMFIQKAARYRISQAGSKQSALQALPLNSGWLTDIELLSPSRYSPAPYADFKNDPALGFWHMDQELAETAEHFTQNYGGKTDQRVTFVQDGKPLPASWIEPVRFQPQEDGITIRVSAAFLDQTPPGVAGAGRPLGHADEPIKFRLIGGWGGGGEQDGPDTFRIVYDHFGPTDNIQIMAYADGNATYKHAEQPCQIKYPAANRMGKPQTIDFPSIPNIRVDQTTIPLSATATSGLPVRYYIRQGPARVDGDVLRIDTLPPRAKCPVTVEVVAYQWGRSIAPLVQTAEPVERSFSIDR